MIRYRTGKAALGAIVGLFAAVQTASAGVITFYTDRAAWLTDALAAGLTVTTDDFSVAPPAYPALTVGGIEFNVVIRSGTPFDALNGRIGYTSGGGRTLGLDFTGGSVGLFGYGVDIGPTVGNVSTTDLDGDSLATGQGGAAGHFVGVLGTVALDPANPFPTNAALAGGDEWGTSGLGVDVWLDNLSVATGAVQANAPASLALLVAGLAGLGWVRRRRPAA